MTPAEPVALTLLIDPSIAAPLIDKIVDAALPVCVSSGASLLQTQAHAIRALEMQLAEQGRELAETQRLLREARHRLAFP